MDSFTLNKIEFNRVREILSGFCATRLGKSLALRIGASRRPDVIRHWLRQVSQMVEALRDHGLPPFGGITDIGAALHRARPGGGASPEDYAEIAAVLEGAGNMRGYLDRLPETLDTLHETAKRIETFPDEVQAIRRIVAPDATVYDEASPRLNGLRREISETSRKIHDVIYGYLRRAEVRPLLQNANVTLHGDRYVLPVKAANRGRLPGVVHRESNTGATVFVEPNASVELNNRLADLRTDEREEVNRLLNELGMVIRRKSDRIASTLRGLAQADLLAAKAQYAYQFAMICPEVSEHGQLELRQARHPLLEDQAWRQERAGVPEDKRHPVVPIDMRLGDDFDILIITGSNTGGKTVTLKTVALLVMMTQSGMHIPAGRGSTLPVFGDVFIDVGDEQSLEQSLSTFGGHVRRVNYILRKSDKNCLVLLDEMGAGTDPDEGGAIGQAILDDLRDKGCLSLITTHLSVLKAYAMNHDRVDNASVEFDVATLTPTYHLRIGTPGESHAITVARKLGMPRRITAAANRHLNAQGRHFRKAIRATGAARQQAESARREALDAQMAAENVQEDYEAKLADLDRLREEFETWLAHLPRLKPGDELYVPSVEKTGTLVRLELHRQRALVDVGRMQIEVPLRELMPDLGQAGIRQQIAQMQQQILEQAEAAQQARAEADRIQKQYRRSLNLHKQQAKQFDQWLNAIGRMNPGDLVPIACKPGKGTLLGLDASGLKASVDTSQGRMELSLQDLFPQTGPFSPAGKKRPGRKRRSHDHEKQKDRPLRRREPDSKAARAVRKAVLAAEPGQQVYVVPFKKQATLVRLDAEKDRAVVQSGVFEMEIPLADLEPAR